MDYSKKSKIRIYFKNGGCDVIPGKLWDDYEVVNGYFVVIKDGHWIAGYNLSEVLAYVIDLKKKKKK